MPSSKVSSAADECIYDLIPKLTAVAIKAPMYRSTFNPNIPPTASTFGAAAVAPTLSSNNSGDMTASTSHIKLAATLGPRNALATNTNKSSERNAAAKKSSKRERVVVKIKPALDSNVKNTTVRTTHKPRNFISENALAVIRAAAKQRDGGNVDYLHKPEYGQVPRYLETVRDSINREGEIVANMIAESKEQFHPAPQTVRLEESERVDLLSELKLRWAEINAAYQTITHMTTLDTTGKVRRKEEYEHKLATIEKAIETLSQANVTILEN